MRTCIIAPGPFGVFVRLLERGLCLAGSAMIVSTTAIAEEHSDIQALLGDLESLRIEHEIASFGLTLVRGDEVLWAGARGVADLTGGEPVDENTVFRIGSITKTFTSLAMLMAEQGGAFRLDDPVKDRLEEVPFSNPWKSSNPIRLAHLLEHTAGFSDLSWEEMRHSDPKPITLEEGLAFRPENRRALWRPGEHASYSNAGSGIAAYVLEHCTGWNFERYVEEKFFDPLGMESATFFLDAATREGLATGYDTDGESIIPYWHMLFRPFGAINVKPRHMAPFLQFMLAEGVYGGNRLLPAAAIRRLEKPQTTLAARTQLSYGYGLGNYAWYRNGLLFHGHGGDGDGYLAHYGYNRDTNMGYFIVITRFTHRPLRRMRNRIEDYITVGHTVPRGKRVRLDHERMDALVGSYESATYRFVDGPDGKAPRPRAIQVIREDESLYTVTATGVRRELVPVSSEHFRRPDQPEATIAVTRDQEGRLTLQGDIGNFRKVDSH